MIQTRGQKRSARILGTSRVVEKLSRHRCDAQDPIYWDIIDNMSNEELLSDVVIEVDEIHTFNCPVDDSTVEKNLEKYETTESEKWDIIVGAMC